ncbi:ribbon-helix-helix protein, CopG family [Luteibacter pinisoli]|uniref:Ribbon-helix-helix protein, CopG family n=1 Tax=Luteibacter pinisoli TaxID=2589080 RepID=A0A4Y5ZAW7_9GAMM|nr:ribbon-helix-helix protein, CopG family [Luteibacter pinisoli]QDE41263.1 ribbon-helix-helix protein, CopG family [Luteibacter pinisoli]
MPDIVVRHIDEQMAERIKQLARERRWSINEVILHALRYGLGLSPGDVFSELLLEPGDIAHLTGAWDAEEQAAFQEALSALTMASPASLSEAAKSYERGTAEERR